MEASDARRTLTVRRVDSTRAATRVRHVDQLSDAALERFTDALEAGRSRTVADGGEPVDGAPFVEGEVIVFTDYYRVELD